MNEGIRRSSKNEFVRLFFGRIRGYQKSFRNYLTFISTHFGTVSLMEMLFIIQPLFQKQN